MKNPLVEQILSETPEDVRIFVSWYGDLVVRIHEIMEEKGITQKELAEKMGKTAPEISRWLSGSHNFTLRSLAKLEAELQEPLLYIPQRVQFHGSYKRKFGVTVFRNTGKKSKGDFNTDYHFSGEATATNLPA